MLWDIWIPDNTDPVSWVVAHTAEEAVDRWRQLNPSYSSLLPVLATKAA